MALEEGRALSEPRMPHLFAEGYGRRDSSKSQLLWELPVVRMIASYSISEMMKVLADIV